MASSQKLNYQAFNSVRASGQTKFHLGMQIIPYQKIYIFPVVPSLSNGQDAVFFLCAIETISFMEAVDDLFLSAQS